VHQGQFMDTYHGKVVTNAKGTRREETWSKAKASYLYSLDEFAEVGRSG
jgi:histone-lysine N-methyltransferase SUV39H